jgi:histone deacetylase HOS2
MTRYGLGCRVWEDDIVQDWTVPGEHVGVDLWRKLSSDECQEVIEQEADENGIERPKGHTVSFHYNARVEGHHFGSKHPMKPWRLTLTKQLVLSYGLQYAMDLFESRMASQKELAAFHSDDYLEFLKRYDFSS